MPVVTVMTVKRNLEIDAGSGAEAGDRSNILTQDSLHGEKIHVK